MSSKTLTTSREEHRLRPGVCVLLSLLLLAVLSLGCEASREASPSREQGAEAASPVLPLIGQRCVVKMRPDACGTAADIPVPYKTTMMNGAELTLIGKLLEINDRWVAVEKLENGPVEYWMPREAIFFIRVARPREKSSNHSETTADHSTSDHAGGHETSQ